MKQSIKNFLAKVFKPLNIFMKWFFKNIVAPRHFKKLDNGKWFKIEILFLYMGTTTVIAVGRLAYSEQYFGVWKTLLDLIICLPALIGWFALARTLFYRSIDELSDIKDEYPLTKLSLSSKWWFKKSEADLKITKELEQWFLDTYGYRFSEMAISWLTWFVVVIWFLLMCLAMVVFSNL